MMWWLFSLLILLLGLWLLAEWGVWKAIEAHCKGLTFDETETQDVREGSSMGRVSLGPSGIFEVQEDGTVVELAPSRWTDESSSGRADHE